jgi:hypothetical protein
MQQADMPSLVTVATFVNPWDAQVACGLLESEGIPFVF